MKKNYLTTIGLILLSFTIQAQLSIDFDSFTLGDVSPQSSDIEMWPDPTASPTDAQVSDEESFSSSNSMKLREQSGGLEDDVLVNLGNKTSGMWVFKWMMYVPAGQNAYWNIQENESIDPAAQWNGEFYVGSTTSGGSAGVISHNDSSNTVAYPEDTWFEIEIIVDLDESTLTIIVDGEEFLDEETYAGNQLGAINYYSTDADTTFYVDDIDFEETCEMPTISDTNGPDYICEGESTTLSVSANGDETNWYDAETEGTLLGSGSFYVTDDLTETTSFWVETVNETSTGVMCSSDREEVIVTVVATPDPPSGDTTQEFTLGETLADLEVSGNNLIWYADEDAITELPETTPLVDGETYYVSQSDEDCEGGLLEITVEETLSTETHDLQGLSFYPNPVKDYIHMEANTPISSVTIYSLTGQKLKEVANENQDLKIDIQGFSSGMYLVKATINNQSKTFRIIKE